MNYVGSRLDAETKPQHSETCILITIYNMAFVVDHLQLNLTNFLVTIIWIKQEKARLTLINTRLSRIPLICASHVLLFFLLCSVLAANNPSHIKGNNIDFHPHRWPSFTLLTLQSGYYSIILLITSVFFYFGFFWFVLKSSLQFRSIPIIYNKEKKESKRRFRE